MVLDNRNMMKDQIKMFLLSKEFNIVNHFKDRIKLDICQVGGYDHFINFYEYMMNSYFHDEPYDHIMMVYDGNYLLDGPANMSFYTAAYNSDRFPMNHHTQQLIDYHLKSKYPEEPYDILVESIHILFKRFLYDQSSDEERALIDSLI